MQVFQKDDVVLGIDIGGTNVRLALVDRLGSTKVTEAFAIKSLTEEKTLDNLVSRISTFVQDNKENQTLLAVGIGVPGIVNNSGRIISCPNLGFLENSDLMEILSVQLNVPVFLEKDVNFILYGEYYTQHLEKHKNLIGFYIGTGFGCSLMINGDIYRGEHGFAGELGHIPLINHTCSCNCGNEGCLELYGAGRSLVERSVAKNVALEDFFTDSRSKHEAANFIEYSAVGILSAINTFDPGLVILGGGVVQMADFPWELLVARIRRGLRADEMREQLEIIPSEAEVFGGCIGAAFYCFDQIR